VLDVQLEADVNVTAQTQRPLLTLTIQDVNKEQQGQLNLVTFLQKEVKERCL
jgi:hypothetical protein